MKNLALATILIGLSGTALSATVDTTGLPSEMANKLANPKATGQIANPVQGYVNSINKKISNYQTEIKNLQTAYPFLTNNPLAQGLINVLDQYYNNVQTEATVLTMTAAANSAPIEDNVEGINTAYEYLVGLTTPPGSCKYVKEDVAETGYLLKKAGGKQYQLYASPDPTTAPVAPILQNAGQIGTGSDFPIQSTDSVVKYILSYDSQQKAHVACLKVISSLTPTTPPVTPTTKPAAPKSTTSTSPTTAAKPAATTNETKK